MGEILRLLSPQQLPTSDIDSARRALPSSYSLSLLESIIRFISAVLVYPLLCMISMFDAATLHASEVTLGPKSLRVSAFNAVTWIQPPPS